MNTDTDCLPVARRWTPEAPHPTAITWLMRLRRFERLGTIYAVLSRAAVLALIPQLDRGRSGDYRVWTRSVRKVALLCIVAPPVKRGMMMAF